MFMPVLWEEEVASISSLSSFAVRRAMEPRGEGVSWMGCIHVGEVLGRSEAVWEIPPHEARPYGLVHRPYWSVGMRELEV
jgi:hypothetical protein